MAEKLENNVQWNEDLSHTFIDYVQHFAPERQHQIEIVVNLLVQTDSHGIVIELCCGEGLLVEAILSQYPNYRVIGFDGSEEM